MEQRLPVDTGPTLLDEALAMLRWSPLKTVTTKWGTRTVQSAAPSKAFERLWHRHGPTLRRQGLTLERYDGRWQVTYWHPRKADAA